MIRVGFEVRMWIVKFLQNFFQQGDKLRLVSDPGGARAVDFSYSIPICLLAVEVGIVISQLRPQIIEVLRKLLQRHTLL
jgi:hypothetical protein